MKPFKNTSKGGWGVTIFTLATVAGLSVTQAEVNTFVEQVVAGFHSWGTAIGIALGAIGQLDRDDLNFGLFRKTPKE